MDILSAVERIDQRPAPRKMRQEPQFDLRVVRTDQDVRRVARTEKTPDFAPFVIPHGDVLQIRLLAGQPAGGSHRLIERSVNEPRALVDERAEALDVGGVQFLDLPVTEDQRDDGMLVHEFFQNFRRGGKALFVFLTAL